MAVSFGKRCIFLGWKLFRGDPKTLLFVSSRLVFNKMIMVKGQGVIVNRGLSVMEIME